MVAHLPTTPATLLGVLTNKALAAGGDPSTVTLACALARNPAVPLTTVHDLIHQADPAHRHLLVRAALYRPGLSTADVQGLLTPQAGALAMVQAYTQLPDPDLTRHLLHVLDTLVGDDPPGAARVWSLILRHPATRPEHAQVAALRLAAHRDHHRKPQADDAVLAHAAKNLDEATTPEQYEAAAGHVHALAAAAPHLAGGLKAVLRAHPEPCTHNTGTEGWLAHPTTTTAQVLSWLVDRPAPDWATALAHHYDPTGQLATEALATHPTSPTVLAALLTAPQKPPVVLQHQQALLAAHDGLDQMRQDLDVGSEVFEEGDPDLAVELARLDIEYGPVNVIERLDLTSAHIDTLLGITTAADTDFCLGVLTHPHATPHQRAQAARRLDSVDTGPDSPLNEPTLEALPRLLPLLAGLDPSDPGDTLRRVGQIHLADYRSVLCHFTTGNALVLPAFLELLGEPYPDQAAVLVHLADTFNGTLSALITTATAVSA